MRRDNGGAECTVRPQLDLVARHQKKESPGHVACKSLRAYLSNLPLPFEEWPKRVGAGRSETSNTSCILNAIPTEPEDHWPLDGFELVINPL